MSEMSLELRLYFCELEIELLRLRLGLTERRDNNYIQDPKTGRFEGSRPSGKGSGGSAGVSGSDEESESEASESENETLENPENSGTMEQKPIEIDVQLFSEADIKKQSSTSIRRGIRNYKRRIIEHKDKIRNPKKYVPDWDSYTEEHKKGLIKHWEKEIKNFEQSLSDRYDELKKRGETE